jgi:transposase
MAKNQKCCTEEFRWEAVRLMETSGKPVAQIARNLGVSDNMLYL